jgi:hypothetical protein
VIIRGSHLPLEGEEVTDPLKSLLQWETSAWVHDPNYLIGQVNRDKDPDDDDLTVLIERRRRSNPSQLQQEQEKTSDGLFGFGVNVHNTHIPFVEFLRNFYCHGNETVGSSHSTCQDSEWIEYLNVQDLRDSNGSVWRPPLSLPSLRKDIPLPNFLQQFLEDSTLSDINLWMGNTFENDGPASPAPPSPPSTITLPLLSGKETTSRLHMDALDNLYVLMSGHKTFRLIPPHLAPQMQTISPTYAVLNNGFSLQYSFLTPLEEEQVKTLLTYSDGEPVTNTILNQLISDESFEYDTNAVKYFHFSSINNLQVSPFLLPPLLPSSLTHPTPFLPSGC